MLPEEEALRLVISMMAENMTETWTTSELYSMYLFAASGTLSRKRFLSSVTAHFGNELLIFHVEGCDSVLGFKANLGKFIKIVKKSSKDDEMEILARKIQNEVTEKSRPGDYNLSE